MVGFPGETQQQFDRLCDFILQYKPDHIGVFAYSKEEGTPSYKLKGHIPKKEKLRRVDIIGEIAFSCAKEKNAALVGKVVDVIYEDIDCDKERFIGRTLLDAPEIDSLVFFTGVRIYNSPHISSVIREFEASYKIQTANKRLGFYAFRPFFRRQKSFSNAPEIVVYQNHSRGENPAAFVKIRNTFRIVRF